MPPSLTTDSRTPPAAGRAALYAAGLCRILASTCCLGPLVLLMLGFSGAWIGNLTALEPYRPIFLVGAVLALALAYQRIFRPSAGCKRDDVCAVPQVRAVYKVIFWLFAILALIALGFPFITPLFY